MWHLPEDFVQKSLNKLQMSPEELLSEKVSGVQTGYGGEKEWLSIANRGYVEASIVQRMSAMPSEVAWGEEIGRLVMPTRAEVIQELAVTPFKVDVMPGGAWKVSTLGDMAGLKLNYPIYISDPSIIEKAFAIRKAALANVDKMLVGVKIPSADDVLAIYKSAFGELENTELKTVEESLNNGQITESQDSNY